MRAFFVILFAMFCVACSKADADRTSADLKNAAKHVARDPAVKQLGSDIKVNAQHAGDQLKKGAVKAKGDIAKAGAKAGEQAKQAASEAKDKAAAKADELKAKATDAKAGDDAKDKSEG
jgi:hypothetical protein